MSVEPLPGVLVIDDEPDTLGGIRAALEFIGCRAVCCHGSLTEASTAIDSSDWPLVLCDINLPGESGLSLLERFGGRGDKRLIMISGQHEIDLAVRCIREGATDYLVKPLEVDRLLASLEQAADGLRAPPAATGAFDDGIISADPAIAALHNYLQAIAPGREPVLITGETGTGKECFARAVHRRSRRQGGFVPVNVASLDEQLFGDSLFGHRKGAFTGAERERPGLVEAATGGTLFLDEIGDLAPASQAALLRLIQEGEYYRLGEDRPRRAEARIVVATNRPIAELGARFRSDLYYRLRVHHIDLPPLRQRCDDIPLLLDHFLEQQAPHYDCHPPPLTADLRQRIEMHAFPGNVRELRGLVIDLILRSRNGLPLAEACDQLLGPVEAAGGAACRSSVRAAEAPLPTIAEATDQLIAEAMRRSGGRVSAAARMLGITRQGLYKRLNKSG